MRALVIGSGMMGSALAYDLAHSTGVDEILIVDIDEKKATAVAQSLGKKVRGERLDVSFYDDVVTAMRGVDVAIGAVSYSQNYLLSNAAIEAGCHFLDLGGNNDVVEKQLSLHDRAAAANVLIVPNCGLAPGMANVLAVGGTARFDRLDSICIRVGGLPQNPRPPLNYQLVFSPEGLINEYVEQAEVIRDGELIHLPSMTEVEEIVFPPPFGALEAFHTSGGVSRLTRMFEGRVRNLDYKTIRYKGHCERFKVLLDLGFGGSEPIEVNGQTITPREVLSRMLIRHLEANGPDVVLMRVTIAGTLKNHSKTLAYDMIDYYDKANRMTAMMRTTAFPTSIMAQMIGRGEVRARGVLTPEFWVPAEPLILELRKRNIIINETTT